MYIHLPLYRHPHKNGGLRGHFLSFGRFLPPGKAPLWHSCTVCPILPAPPVHQSISYRRCCLPGRFPLPLVPPAPPVTPVFWYYSVLTPRWPIPTPPLQSRTRPCSPPVLVVPPAPVRPSFFQKHLSHVYAPPKLPSAPSPHQLPRYRSRPACRRPHPQKSHPHAHPAHPTHPAYYPEPATGGISRSSPNHQGQTAVPRLYDKPPAGSSHLPCSPLSPHRLPRCRSRPDRKSVV